MKRSHIAVLFSLVSLLTVSCSKIAFTNGEPITENRPLGHFRAISIHNNVNVKLLQSDHPNLEITCPRNLIENVTTQIVGDTLVIKNENTLSWIRSFDYSIDLTIYYDSLREVNFASIGELKSAEGDSIRGIKTPQISTVSVDSPVIFPTSFNLNVMEGSGNIDLTIGCDILKHRFTNGTSHVTLKGKCGYSEHASRSYGTIHAENLSSNFVYVESESTNDIYVWAKTGLRVWLYSIGNIYYKGNPETLVEACTSDGRLIRLE